MKLSSFLAFLKQILFFDRFCLLNKMVILVNAKYHNKIALSFSVNLHLCGTKNYLRTSPIVWKLRNNTNWVLSIQWAGYAGVTSTDPKEFLFMRKDAKES